MGIIGYGAECHNKLVDNRLILRSVRFFYGLNFIVKALFFFVLSLRMKFSLKKRKKKHR